VWDLNALVDRSTILKWTLKKECVRAWILLALVRSSAFSCRLTMRPVLGRVAYRTVSRTEAPDVKPLAPLCQPK
jgi:hypothetical protein